MPTTTERHGWRDTLIYADTDRQNAVCGLLAAKCFTNENVYSMLEICCVFTAPFSLVDGGGCQIPRDEGNLRPGKYYMVTEGCITASTEAVLGRTGLGTGYRPTSFREEVRRRDTQCAISGRKARLAHLHEYDMFHTCHIFPLMYEQQWLDSKYGDWITIPPVKESDGTINSVQNGMLLSADVHALFDAFKVSVNPDENYKVVCFAPDTLSLDYNIAGRHLDQTFLDKGNRPVDEVLRWHYRQAVLVNMRGAGESSS